MFKNGQDLNQRKMICAWDTRTWYFLSVFCFNGQTGHISCKCQLEQEVLP